MLFVIARDMLTEGRDNGTVCVAAHRYRVMDQVESTSAPKEKSLPAYVGRLRCGDVRPGPGHCGGGAERRPAPTQLILALFYSERFAKAERSRWRFRVRSLPKYISPEKRLSFPRKLDNFERH